jgi:hypothetical protein
MRLRSAGAIAVFVLVLSAPGIAAADQGVSIDLGAIEVDEPLDRGGTYRLPVMRVTNEGTDPATFVVSARPVSDQDDRQIDESWFTIEPSRFVLDAESTKDVAIELTIPTDARSGSYAGLIGPSTAPDTDGATVGAGVAAKISFDVAPSGWSPGSWIGSAIRDHTGWSVAVLGLFALAVVFLVLRRRYSFRIERR